MSTYSIEISKTIGHIASRWQETDKSILRKLFPLLAEGKPASPILYAQVGQQLAARQKQGCQAYTIYKDENKGHGFKSNLSIPRQLNPPDEG